MHERKEKQIINYIVRQYLKKFCMKKLPTKVQDYIYEIMRTKDRKELLEIQKELCDLFFLVENVPDMSPQGIPVSWMTVTHQDHK